MILWCGANGHELLAALQRLFNDPRVVALGDGRAVAEAEAAGGDFEAGAICLVLYSLRLTKWAAAGLQKQKASYQFSY